MGFSMISPKARLDVINKSQIKTPAVVTSVKTIYNRKGNRTQLVKLDGLYNNSGKKYEAKCYNFKGIFRGILPWKAAVCITLQNRVKGFLLQSIAKAERLQV